MSEKKINKIRDHLELSVLITLFVVSILAVSPPGVEYYIEIKKRDDNN